MMTEEEQKIVSDLQAQVKKLTEERDRFRTEAEKLQAEHQDDQVKIENLTQAVLYLRKKIFGRRSEVSQTDGQYGLFDDFESADAADKAVEDTLKKQQEDLGVKDKNPKTAKRSGIAGDKLKDLPVEIEDVVLSGDAAVCEKCGAPLKEVGKKVVRTEVIYQRASLKVKQYVEHVYKCTKCGSEPGKDVSAELEGRENHSVFCQAESPAPLLAHCILSYSLAAAVFYQKYQLGLPLNRQEQYWRGIGLLITRKDMCRWVNRVCDLWLSALVERMHEIQLKEAEVIHADETRIQCNHEPKRKASSDSCMWIAVTGVNEQHPVVYFMYTMTRNQEHVQELLKDWKGCLVTDGYAGYHVLKDVTHGLCWCHLRRKFLDSIPLDNSGKKIPGSKGQEAVTLIDKIFHADAKLKDLTPEERQQKRIETTNRYAEQFWKWQEETSKLAATNEKLTEALNYAQNQREGLNTFMKDGRIPLSNNRAEEHIRPFATHRRAWLFADTQDGARANATACSFFETAKANGLDGYEYIKYCLSQLPNLDFHNHKELLDDLLPWSDKLPESCRIKHPSEDAAALGEPEKDPEL